MNRLALPLRAYSVLPHRMPGHHRQHRLDLGLEFLARLVEADQGNGGIDRGMVGINQQLHCRHEAGIPAWRDYKALRSPGLEIVFLRALRTVSGQAVGTISNSIARSVSIRRDQRAKPGGGSVQATAASSRSCPSEKVGVREGRAWGVRVRRPSP